MEEVTMSIPTEDELKELNPDGVEINMDLINEDTQLEEEDLVQDSFNEDNVMGNYDEDGNLNMEGVENA